MTILSIPQYAKIETLEPEPEVERPEIEQQPEFISKERLKLMVTLLYSEKVQLALKCLRGASGLDPKVMEPLNDPLLRMAIKDALEWVRIIDNFNGDDEDDIDWDTESDSEDEDWDTESDYESDYESETESDYESDTEEFEFFVDWWNNEDADLTIWDNDCNVTGCLNEVENGVHCNSCLIKISNYMQLIQGWLLLYNFPDDLPDHVKQHVRLAINDSTLCMNLFSPWMQVCRAQSCCVHEHRGDSFEGVCTCCAVCKNIIYNHIIEEGELPNDEYMHMLFNRLIDLEDEYESADSEN